VPAHLPSSLTSSTQPEPIMGALLVACRSTPMTSTPRTSLPLSEQQGCSIAVTVCAARRDFPLHFVGEHIAEYPIWHSLGGERVTQTYRHKLQFPDDPHQRCPIRVHGGVIVPLVHHGQLSFDASRMRSPSGARDPLDAKRLWRRAVPPSPHTSPCAGVVLACRHTHDQPPPERHALRRSSVQTPAYSHERDVSEGNAARIS